ncbi:hypothetical protein MKW98_018471 [Papaver atlanticum]|uniref:Uncharacterized protein n=1 Tax=Papaver atlanticum TaxID=357466 RepID=A0AAD4TFY2_9MAGN|nr:hypothetical protein MKW98_018471 [Papaver atlanticum]
MREDFLTDKEYFYLNNPVILNVHPPVIDHAHATYLNAFHDVHQLYGNFYDDDDNDYYSYVDAHETLILHSSDTVTDAAFGQAPASHTDHVTDSGKLRDISDIVETCHDTKVIYISGESINGVQPMVDAGDHDVVGADGGPRVIEPNSNPKEVDVVVITSSNDEA